MTVTKGELIERTEALLPGIAARARESEEQRRPHDDTIRELIDAEIFQSLVPACYGGHELNLDTHAEIVRRLASACMSTAWVAAFYIGHNWMLTKFPEQAQRDVFADRPFTLTPIQPSPGIVAKEVRDGYEITGRSSFSSGIMHADWVIIAGAGAPDSRAFVVPVGDCEVDDVWFMSGMAGTGSNDVVVENVFVPAHRTMLAADVFNTVDSIHPNPLYHIPLLPFIYCEVMGVYTGGLAGALAVYEAHVLEKTMTWGGDAIAGKQATQVNLGIAHARANAAAFLYDRLVSDTMATAVASGFTLDRRLELKLLAGFIGDTCREGVNAMMARAGTKNFALDAPLQRFFRDMNTLASHAFIDWEVSAELYGRHRLGLEPNSPLV